MSIDKPADVLDAARRIQAELPPDAVPDLAALIAKASQAEPQERREQAADALYAYLARHPGTRDRLNELLPASDEERGGGFEYPGGDPFTDYDRYACPEGHYAWPVLDVDDPTPGPISCPQCGAPLVFKPTGE